MYKILPFVVITFLFVGCSEEQEETNLNNTGELINEISNELSLDTVSVDSTALSFGVNVNALLEKADQEYQLPFKIDSTFISGFTGEAEDEYDLTAAEAKYLAINKLDNEITDMAGYNISTFIKLDSIKNSGDWDDYQSTLDLGMARYSNGNVVGTVQIDEHLQILLWSIDYATYEACPYGSGTYIFGTLFALNHALNTCLLGEMSGGGDPPAWGDTRAYAEITSEMISITSLDRSGEEDYDGMDFVDKREFQYEISMSLDGFVVEKTEGGEWSGDNY